MTIKMNSKKKLSQKKLKLILRDCIVKIINLITWAKKAAAIAEIKAS